MKKKKSLKTTASESSSDQIERSRVEYHYTAPWYFIIDSKTQETLAMVSDKEEADFLLLAFNNWNQIKQKSA